MGDIKLAVLAPRSPGEGYCRGLGHSESLGNLNHSYHMCFETNSWPGLRSFSVGLLEPIAIACRGACRRWVTGGLIEVG